VAIAVTQCGGGRVELERYEASARLLEAGVVSGHDITPEAALVKLMVLLGDPALDPAGVRSLLNQDIAGEQTIADRPSHLRSALPSA
jgi:L-asparaginase